MSITVQTSPIKLTRDVNDVAANFLKENYLTGLNFVDSSGQPIPDKFFEMHIQKAVSRVEHVTKVDILRRTVTDEPHDYYIGDYQQFAYLQANRYPVIDDKVNFPASISAVYPTGQFIMAFPAEWVRLNSQHGQMQLVPTQGTLSSVILGQGGSYLPLIYRDMGYLPSLFRASYTSGFKDGEMPETIIDAVCKMACINVLTVMQDTVMPVGLASISSGIDGVSQGVGLLPGPFKVRLDAYKKDLFGDNETGAPGLLKEIKDEYRGITWVVC